MSNDLAKDMVRVSRLRALLHTYAQANSIIAARTVRTALTHNEQETTPAWTDFTGSVITFNAAQLGPIETRDDYVRVTGVDYHELAHVLFTPMKGDRKYNALYARASQQDGQEFFQAFTALEDQRIESMLVTKAPAVRPYYESMVAGFILDNPELEPMSYLMVYGRKYLGQEIIEAARDRWGYDEDLRDEATDIIDRFRVLDLAKPMNLFTAISLAVRFMELLRKLKPPVPPSLPHGDNAHGGCDSENPRHQSQSAAGSSGVKAGKDKPKDEQDDQQQSGGGKGQGNQGDDEEEGEGQGGGQGEDESDENEDGPSEGDGDADKGEAKNNPTNQADDGEGDGGENVPGGGAGNEVGVHTAGTTLEELLSLLAKATGDSMQVQHDAATYRAKLNAGHLMQDLQTYPYWADGAGAASPVTLLVDRVAREWRRLVEKADPGWNYRQDQGRFSVQRYALGERDTEQLFDAWDEGVEDATSVEGVLLLDISGSVDAWRDMLSGAAWVIKRAFDTIDAPLTVIAYDTDGFMVYRRDERASTIKFPSFSCHGGTSPMKALQTAYTILANSPRKKRYLCTMTDGAWWGNGMGTMILGSNSGSQYTYDEMLTAIGALPGCVTQMVYFDAPRFDGLGNEMDGVDPAKLDWHEHKVRTVIRDMAALVTVVRSAVSALIATRR